MTTDSIRLKDALQMPLSYGLNESAIEDNPQWPRYIRITDFDDNNNLREDTFRSINPEKANMYSLQKGDILLARSGATVGKAFCFNESIRACYAGYLIRARLNQKKVLPKYFLYVTKSIHYSEWKKRTNIQSTIQNISAEKYNQYEFPCPTINKQEKIIEYLDTKLSEIDHQVSILTSKRDAYLRLKKSIINHAVTRGLNTNVKMKDSGIEWIGEVPEHWEVKRLKNVVECNAKSLGENTPKDSIIKYVEISNVDHVHGINNIQSLMFGEAPSRARRITQKGDIIISTVRTYLKAIAKIEDDDIIVSTGFAVLHPTKCNGEYLAYYILSESFINRVEMLSKGTSYPAINASDLVSINVLIPPLPEQRVIATYLDDKCAKIDTIVSNLDKHISRYADLKRSLIDEVITGKRAV